MTIDQAIQQVGARFPFPGYTMPHGRAKAAYGHVARAAVRYLDSGATILDFGCGPCDLTAVLQLLGFQCSACDDLQDDWHKIPGNREKIIAFAESCGIHVEEPSDRGLPFKKGSFDMIMLHDVLEHLHDSPRDLLNDLLELATPHGLLFVTVPNAGNLRKRLSLLCGGTNLPRFAGYYWYPGPWRGHIREYVKTDLLKLCAYLSLDIVELRACDRMIDVLPRLLRAPYRAATAICRGWKDSWSLVARKKPKWAPRKTLPHEELVQLLGKTTSYDYT